MKHKSLFFATITLMAVMSVFSSCNSGNDVTPATDSTKLWPAYSNGKWGYINNKGTFEIPAQFDGAETFSCGYARVSLSGKTMFIDKSGKLQNMPTVDGVSSFYNHYAIVNLSGKYGLMNTDFEFAVQPIYYSLGYVSANGFVPARLTSDGKYGYINTKGDVKILSIYDGASSFVGNYAHINIDSNSGAIDKSGEYVVQPIYEGVNNVIPIGNDRFIYRNSNEYKYGLLDNNGQLVVMPVYDYIEEDVPYDWDVIPAELNDKYGFIDKNGNEKIPFLYDVAHPFYEGYAYVELNGTKLMIDESGNIAFTFAESESLRSYGLHNGLMLTYSNGTFYYKNIKGTVVYAWSTNSGNGGNYYGYDDYYYSPARYKVAVEGNMALPADARIYHLGK